MRNKTRYAMIGYVVSKFVFPIARRQAKAQAKRRAKGAATGTVNAAKAHPARTSIALGAAAGAIGWLATRRRAAGDDVDALDD